MKRRKNEAFPNAVSDLSTIPNHRLLSGSASQRDFDLCFYCFYKPTCLVHSTTKDAFVWLEHPIKQVHLGMMAAVKFQKCGIFTKDTNFQIFLGVASIENVSQ